MEGQNAASRHACLCKRVRIQTATARRGASRRCRLRVDRPSESQAEAGVFCRRRDAFQNTGAGSRELLRGHGAGTSRVSCTSSCCGTLRDFWEVPCGFLFVKPTQKFIVLLSWESSVSPGLRALSSQFLMLN